MTDDPALAVRANRCERMDCALKAIEGVALAAGDHFEGLIIFVFANFAFSHKGFSGVEVFSAVSESGDRLGSDIRVALSQVGQGSKPNPTHLLPPARPGALLFLRGREVSECRSLVVLCKSP